MDIPVTFLDFKTKENYLALQNKFSRFGEKNNLPEDDYQKVVKDDFTIIYKSINPLTDLEDYFEYSFIEDFILFKISKLAIGYVDFFKKHIQNDLLNDTDKTKRAAEIQLKKLYDLIEIINKAEYLIKKIKVKLQTQIDIVVEYLSNVHILPHYTIEEKFKMNMNKIDIIVLFLLLRQKNKIIEMKDSHLGFLIEKTFMYKDGNEYTTIKNAGKVVNGVKHYSEPVKKSINRLRDLFNDKGFYELNIE